MATSRPMRRSRARQTSPMPPAPMCARTSYGPTVLPFVMVMGGTEKLRDSTLAAGRRLREGSLGEGGVPPRFGEFVDEREQRGAGLRGVGRVLDALPWLVPRLEPLPLSAVGLATERVVDERK